MCVGGSAAGGLPQSWGETGRFWRNCEGRAAVSLAASLARAKVKLIQQICLKVSLTVTSSVWALATPSYDFLCKYNRFVFYLVLGITLIFHVVPLRHI